jgi:hypothetical protein
VILSALGVAVPTLAAGLVFARRTLDSYDAQIMFTVAKSIVTTHTTYVPPAADAFGINTPHSSYGLGQSLLEVPAYLLATHTGHNPEAFAMLVNPALLAVTGMMVWAWARTAFATPGQAAAVALTVCFGTLLLTYAPTGGSELGTALGITVAILGVELIRRQHLVGAAVASVGVTIAVFMRPDSALLVGVPVAIAVLLCTRRGFALFLLLLAPAAALTAAYNGSHGGQYAGTALTDWFSYPLVGGVYGLLLSPGRGLLLYVPLTVLALVAIPWAWNRSRLVTGLCLALLIIRIPFYAKLYSWNGGWAWGPRFLVPAMPCLAPLLFEILRRFSWRRLPQAAAVCMVLALSISVQVVGASVRYDTDTANVLMTEPHGPGDSVLFEWRYFPVWEHVRALYEGRDLAIGYRGPPGPDQNDLKRIGQ